VKQSRDLARRKASGLMAFQLFITFRRPKISRHCQKKGDSRSIGNRQGARACHTPSIMLRADEVSE
jgi:hypothetical protein